MLLSSQLHRTHNTRNIRQLVLTIDVILSGNSTLGTYFLHTEQHPTVNVFSKDGIILFELRLVFNQEIR